MQPKDYYFMSAAGERTLRPHVRWIEWVAGILIRLEATYLRGAESNVPFVSAVTPTILGCPISRRFREKWEADCSHHGASSAHSTARYS